MHPALELLHPIIVIVWIAFGLSVVGCGLWLASSHLPKEANFFYFGGLLLLAVTGVSIYPSLMRTHLGEDVRTLQDVAHMAREDLGTERSARVQDRRTIIWQKEELNSAKAATLAVEDALQKEKKEHQLTKDNLVKVTEAHAILGKRSAAAHMRHIRLRALLKQTQQALLKERWMRAEAVRVTNVSFTPSVPPDWLAGGYSTDKYTITPREGALIQTFNGHFFKVELQKAQNAAFVFAPKQFTLGAEEPTFVEKLQAMLREVVSKVRTSSHAKLVLRGRADAGGPLGTFPSQHDSLRQMEYLAAIDSRDDLFSSTAKVTSIPSEYHNDHLPMLRAAYVRNLIARVEPELRVALLEGDVKGQGASDRRVDIFLYLESLWPLP